MNESLTDRQLEILRYVARHIDRHGWQPSYREIGRRFRIRSPNGVRCHFKSMEAKGIVKVHTHRSIEFPWREYL